MVVHVGKPLDLVTVSEMADEVKLRVGVCQPLIGDPPDRSILGETVELGDEVFMLLTLMDETEKLPVAGKIVWITPPGAQGSRVAGIGVQFSNQDNGAVRNKIEGYLGGALKSERQTHTM